MEISGDRRDELQRFLGGQSLAELARGINSQPKDLALEVDPELQKNDEECRAKLLEYPTEECQAKREEYYLKLVAYIILASTVGRSTREILRDLRGSDIMWSYNNVDEMIFRWKAALAQGWPDDLRERLSGISAAGRGSLRDRRNDVECTLLDGRKKAISLDKLVEPSYGSVDASPDEVLYRSQYGEWILVSDEARELTPIQAHAWFWKNQIDLPDSLQGIDPHDMDASEKKASDLTPEEKNERVRNYLIKHSMATSALIATKTGIPEQTVRCTWAWKTRPTKGKVEPQRKERQLTDKILAAKENTKVVDPSASLEALDERESVERRYIEAASPGQKADYFKMDQIEQDNVLVAHALEKGLSTSWINSRR